ncbi:MAG TPA: lysophospholipid acyltransferase family protein [Rariglobus sp.]|jgi:1-acyl-sn-glycerol-3-phosphate acyltransferase|nr:lysophospholipid acyltransferase family protein [Rariglobus sp.]
MKPLRSLWLPFAYYMSWILFGLGGLALNIACVPLLFSRDRERFGPQSRRSTRWMFDFWLRWMHASGVVHVTWKGFDRPLTTGTVYVANHPSLVDAPFLLARLPDAVCIFKPALLRNPFIAPAALMSGYVSGDQGVDLIRNAAQRVAAGQSLLIFPEGTRTAPGILLNPLKPGFALIAQRANAPIQIIRVIAGPCLARKGHPWWRLPPLPGRVEFILGDLIPADQLDNPATFTGHLAEQLEASLAAEPSSA